MSENNFSVDKNRECALSSYLSLNASIEKMHKEEQPIDQGEESLKKMKAYLRKLPLMIKNEGLISTLCFIKSKGYRQKSIQKEEKEIIIERTEYGYIY